MTSRSRPDYPEKAHRVSRKRNRHDVSEYCQRQQTGNDANTSSAASFQRNRTKSDVDYQPCYFRREPGLRERVLA